MPLTSSYAITVVCNNTASLDAHLLRVSFETAILDMPRSLRTLFAPLPGYSSPNIQSPRGSIVYGVETGEKLGLVHVHCRVRVSHSCPIRPSQEGIKAYFGKHLGPDAKLHCNYWYLKGPGDIRKWEAYCIKKGTPRDEEEQVVEHPPQANEDSPCPSGRVCQPSGSPKETINIS